MSIGTLLGGGVASILTGGTLGVLGAVGSGILDFFRSKEKNKHELAVITAQKELALANASSVTLLESIKMMGASYENDKANYGGGFVDTLRGTLRPIVTYCFIAISIGMAIWAFKQVRLELEFVKEIAKYSVYTCLDIASLCVSWYFGARQIDKIQRR